MNKPELFSRHSWETFSAATIRQLKELWPMLTWPDQPLPILDVGCGPGDIAAKFLAPSVPKGTKIVVSDVSPEMVEYSRKQNSVPEVVMHEVLDIMEPDIEKTAVWKNGPYSKVFGTMMLQCLPDNRGAIQNIYKLLSPGGEAIFVVIPKVALWGAYEEMAKDPRWKQYMQDVEKFMCPYYHSADPASELRQLMVDVGFQVLHCWCGPMEVEYSSDEEVKQFLVSLIPFLDRMPKEEKEAFSEEVLQWYYKLDNLRKEKGGRSGQTKVIYSYTSMVAVGRKH